MNPGYKLSVLRIVWKIGIRKLDWIKVYLINDQVLSNNAPSSYIHEKIPLMRHEKYLYMPVTPMVSDILIVNWLEMGFQIQPSKHTHELKL